MSNLLERIIQVVMVLGLVIGAMLVNIAVPVGIIYLGFVIAGHFGVL